MIEPGATNRASRNRRFVALMAWGGLVLTTFFLCDARQIGSMRSTVAEPICFLLASFAAIVSVFAWMLFNPNRRSARESPSLFFAAAATLFPPPIIAFCLMPADSPLRGWLAFAVFMLCVIAVLSRLPDEFIGVPRGRHTYLVPIPAFDRVKDSALDPNAAWFRFTELSQIVSDAERPSLAPRAYLQRENVRPEPRRQVQVRPASDVDDILGTDFDISLLDELLIDDDVAPEQLRVDHAAERQRRNQPYPVDDRSDISERPRRRTSNPVNGAAGPVANGAAALPAMLPLSPIQTPLPQSVRDHNTPSEQSQQTTTESDDDHRRAAAAFTTDSATLLGVDVPAAEADQTGAQASPAEPARYEAVLPKPAAQPNAEGPDVKGPLSPELHRTLDDGGSEVVEGVIRVRFDKGQKRANLHVPFSPPLPGKPDVECECVGDEALRLKVPDRQSYGIRIEARRSNADEAMDTEVGFAAVCPPESSS
ncbi:MAG: hypothetical protein GY903_23220 [Fuerstiella sp.]|nr:hypothetical protein [Fuerstiella sp.]MCP4857405.1 hypothetical protein [Fuerstiella sp.]